MRDTLIKGVRLLDGATALCAWPGKATAWLCLAIIGLSLLSTAAGLLRVHQFAEWSTPVFLLGTQFNSTSLQELQWHCFAVMMLFAGSYTFALDGHVRVDVFYARMSDKAKVAVNTLGDLFFLLPFAVLVILNSMELVRFSWLTHEASSEMGLTHRWVIKAVLPAGMALLAAQAGFRGLSGALRFIGLCAGLRLADFAPRKQREGGAP